MSDAGSSIAAASEPIYSQPFLHNHAGLQVGVSGGGGHGSTRYKLTFFTKLRLLLTLFLAKGRLRAWNGNAHKTQKENNSLSKHLSKVEVSM